MNEDAKKIAMLCGEFGDSYQPITRALFWKIFHASNDSIDNVKRFRQFNSCNFEIEELE